MPFDLTQAGPILFSEPAPAIAGTCSGALLVIGGARCVWEDLARAPKNLPVMAVNDIGIFYEHRVRHWTTLHPEFLPAWIEIRRRRGFDNLAHVETHGVKRAPGVITAWPIQPHGGNSGLFACIVGLLLGYESIVLAGVPMDATGHFFDPPGAKQMFGRADLVEWEWARDAFFANRVRSLSGRTREILGAPDGVRA